MNALSVGASSRQIQKADVLGVWAMSICDLGMEEVCSHALMTQKEDQEVEEYSEGGGEGR